MKTSTARGPSKMIRQLAFAVALAAIALGVLALAGCNNEAKKAGEVGLGQISVWRDADKDVTCWIFDGYQKGGLSCLPDWMLERAGQADDVSLEPLPRRIAL